ncbi:MAG: ribose-phosphate pyrophosphokinase [Candidatus Delongbacteria bacterium]|nr:ribose-phosphate pyrophosphokinase [Candidatus Delongbacteria bacterium]
MKIFAGDSNPGLATSIANRLGLELGDVRLKRFSDGEMAVKYRDNIRGSDLFIIQSTSPPADNILQLLLMLDAARRSSARRITAVLPYFGYARQDRKDQPRVAIGAKLVADLLVSAGADRVLTMDLHAAQIQGFFNIPFDHIYASTVFIPYWMSRDRVDLTVLAPDIGSIKMARAYAQRLDAGLAVIDKRRPEPNSSEVMNLIGEVENRNVLILDDMVDTAGTISLAAKTVLERGATTVRCACTHPVLSGPALSRIAESGINEFTITDTLPLRDEVDSDMFKVLTVAGVFAEAIKRIHEEKSLSSLFVE